MIFSIVILSFPLVLVYQEAEKTKIKARPGSIVDRCASKWYFFGHKFLEQDDQGQPFSGTSGNA